MHAKTKSELKRLESKFGYRYSILLELPYFDPISMLPVDPMHNLYLGTAKYIFNIWLDRGILSSQSIKHINNCLTSFRTSNILNLPSIDNSKYTAEQWMLWVNFYSLICLWNILNDPHLECWRNFVLASRILCKEEVTKEEVALADGLLQFCHRFERIYGQEAVTPNIHMHAYLCGCIMQYGSMSSFWLYSFERYNGILGDIPTNNRSIEAQIMKFVKDTVHFQMMHNLPPGITTEIFAPILCLDKTHYSSKSTSFLTSNGTEYTGLKYKIKVFESSFCDDLLSLY